MAYVEQDSSEDGTVTETRTWNDDGSFTRRKGDANGPVIEQASAPPGIVKAIGDYNGETAETVAAAKLKGLRAKVEADRGGTSGGVNLGLNVGTIQLLNAEISNLQDLVLALVDARSD